MPTVTSTTKADHDRKFMEKKGILKKDKKMSYPIAPKDKWYGEGTYEKQGGVMRKVTPDEYIKKVRPLSIDDESRENIDLLKEHIKSGKSLDPLLIRENGKEDGRHRAYAAKELGISHVPVIDYGKHFEKHQNW
jgi:hypothetical protein